MNPTLSPRSLTLVLVALVIVAGSLLASAAGAAQVKKDKPPPKPLTGTLVVNDKTWTCNMPVNLDLVQVTVSAKIRSRTDAIHVQSGCTGRIGNLQVVQYSGDAVKVAEGAHDLTIGGGSIKCFAKAPTMHQDGVQVMGGARITFSNLSIDCGRATDTLIDSNFFVNKAGQSKAPPSDVVCDHCTLGAWTAHTVNLENSLRSGLSNSTLCVGRYPKLTLTIGSGAASPVNTGNVIKTC